MTDTRISGIFILAFFFVISGVSASSGFTVTANVERTSIMAGETLSLTLSTSDDVSDLDPDTSVIRDFDILSQSSSSMMQFVNGKMSVNKSVTIELSPKKTGTLAIPAIKVTSGSEIAHTKLIEINVREDRSPVSDRTEDGENFAESRLSRSVIYMGQPVIYNFSLYFREQIARPNLTLPDFQDFTSTEIKSPSSYTKTIKGVPYNVLEKNVLLTPRKPGHYTFDPALLVYESASGVTRDFFGFPQQRLQRESIRTKAMAIEVKKLPPVPDGLVFSGFVGDLSVKTGIEKTDLKTGDSGTLTIEFEGKGGRTGDIGRPDVKIPSSFKVYPDEPELREDSGSEGFSGKKIFRMALVPTEPGRFVIEPLKITFFDSDSGIYKTAKTEPVNITVSQGEGGLSQPVHDAPEKKDVKSRPGVSEVDIFHIKTSLDATRNESSFSFLWFVIFVLLPPSTFFLSVMALRIFSGTRTKSAKLKKESLDALKKATSAHNSEEFLSIIYRSFVYAAASLTDLNQESVTSPGIASTLEKAGTDSVAAQEFSVFFEEIEMLRFSGIKVSSDRMKEIRESAEKLIRRII